jgi:hypothetical protein
MELFRVNTDAITGETTKVPYTQKEIDECNNYVDTKPHLTVKQLQAQLAEISAQLQALQGAA